MNNLGNIFLPEPHKVINDLSVKLFWFCVLILVFPRSVWCDRISTASENKSGFRKKISSILYRSFIEGDNHTCEMYLDFSSYFLTPYRHRMSWKSPYFSLNYALTTPQFFQTTILFGQFSHPFCFPGDLTELTPPWVEHRGQKEGWSPPRTPVEGYRKEVAVAVHTRETDSHPATLVFWWWGQISGWGRK